MTDLSLAESTLRTVFGFPGFRPGQAEILAAVLEGNDVLAVMPTGSGKSLCYQLPALLRDGLTVVVSPLISLMRNQVAQLNSYGIAAASLTSANQPAEHRAIVERIGQGALRLVYVAPERLTRPDTLELLKRARVALLAVDEAHCISQWGHDFRPDYMALGPVQDELGGVQTMALTATADAATRADILERLFRRPAKVFVHGFDRPNLRLAIQAKTSSRRPLLDFLEARRGASGIVYCSTRKQTEDLAALLCSQGFRALPYHAGMDPAARSRHQDCFLQEDGVVVAATVAFGMGIDKPDVRFVAHANLPKTIESYYQEIGRAGRDGLAADTLMLYGMEDIRVRRQQIDASEASDEQKRVERQRLNALVALCEAPRCRRHTLLAYFGEAVSGPCGNCDLCIDGVEVADGTLAAQKALSAMVRTGQRFGSEHLISLLLGEETEAITRFGHQRLPTFGVGKEYSRNEWRSIFRQLYASGVIALDVAGYGSWTVGETGRAVLKGETRIELRKDRLQPRRSRRSQPGAAAAPELPEADRPLFEALRKKRLALALEQRVPAYVVLADRSLIEMARQKPLSAEKLGRIHGVGRAKLAQYGEVFLEVVREHLAQRVVPSPHSRSSKWGEG